MSKERWGASKWIRGRLRILIDSSYNIEGEPKHNLNEVLHGMFLSIIDTAFMPGLEKPHYMALLKRANFIVASKGWLYVRPASAFEKKVHRISVPGGCDFLGASGKAKIDRIKQFMGAVGRDASSVGGAPHHSDVHGPLFGPAGHADAAPQEPVVDDGEDKDVEFMQDLAEVMEREAIMNENLVEEAEQGEEDVFGLGFSLNEPPSEPAPSRPAVTLKREPEAAQVFRAFKLARKGQAPMVIDLD